MLFDQQYAVRSLGSPPTTHPWLLDSLRFCTNTPLVKPVVLAEGHDVHSSRLFSSPSCYLQLFLCFISVHHPWLLSVTRPFIIPLFLPRSIQIAGTAATLFYQAGTQRAQKQFALEWPRNIMKLHPLQRLGEKYFLPSYNNRFCCFHAA